MRTVVDQIGLCAIRISSLDQYKVTDLLSHRVCFGNEKPRLTLFWPAVCYNILAGFDAL